MDYSPPGEDITPLAQIWHKVREHYGLQPTGEDITPLAQIWHEVRELYGLQPTGEDIYTSCSDLA